MNNNTNKTPFSKILGKFFKTEFPFIMIAIVLAIVTLTVLSI